MKGAILIVLKKIGYRKAETRKLFKSVPNKKRKVQGLIKNNLKSNFIQIIMLNNIIIFIPYNAQSRGRMEQIMYFLFC